MWTLKHNSAINVTFVIIFVGDCSSCLGGWLRGDEFLGCSGLLQTDSQGESNVGRWMALVATVDQEEMAVKVATRLTRDSKYCFYSASSHYRSWGFVP
jgi:hypothetical protein